MAQILINGHEVLVSVTSYKIDTTKDMDDKGNPYGSILTSVFINGVHYQFGGCVMTVTGLVLMPVDKFIEAAIIYEALGIELSSTGNSGHSCNLMDDLGIYEVCREAYNAMKASITVNKAHLFADLL